MCIAEESVGFIPKTLSVCMIVKNEEKLLGRCLDSIKCVADEIVVVDTGSIDSTVDIAKKYGAKVLQVQWKNDFAWARNISIRNATCQWLLWLDADDVVPPESIPKLMELKKRVPDRIFALVVRNQRPGNTGTEFMQARMFPNSQDIFFERSIHEQIMPSALRLGMKMENQDIIVEHHGYAEPEILKKKAQRNVQMLLQEFQSSGGDAVMQVEIADSFLIIEDYDNAVKWYENVLSIERCKIDSPAIAAEAYSGLGTIYLKKELFKKAAEYFKYALELSPWRLDIYYNMAVALENIGENNSALECLKTIIEAKMQPGQVGVDFRTAKIKALLRVLRLLMEAGDLEQAEKIGAQAVSLFPERQEIFNMAGKIFLKRNKLMDAIHAFEKSLSIIKEGNIEAYIGLCIIYRIAGRNDLVIQTINSIEPLFKDNDRYQVFSSIVNGNGVASPADEFSEQLLNKMRKEFFFVF